MRLDRFLDLTGPYVIRMTRGPAECRREFFTIPAPRDRTVFLGDRATKGLSPRSTCGHSSDDRSRSPVVR